MDSVNKTEKKERKEKSLGFATCAHTDAATPMVCYCQNNDSKQCSDHLSALEVPQTPNSMSLVNSLTPLLLMDHFPHRGHFGG